MPTCGDTGRMNTRIRLRTDQWPLVYWLIGANVVLFLLQQASPQMILQWMALWPAGTPDTVAYGGRSLMVPQFWPWQLISYGFLHGGFGHLFFNMFALWMFGLPLEYRWGSHRFAFYYFVCLIGAGLVQLVLASSGDDIYPTVGASGAVFGLLLAYGLTYPKNKIFLIFFPVPIEARWFVIIYGAIELFLGLGGLMPGIAHFAHLGGMAFGLAVFWWWGWRPGRPPP